MEPGLGDSVWDVLKFCLVWALVWPGLAWFGLVGRRAPPETSSKFAWFGPWFGLVWPGLAWLGGAPRLRHPQNLPGLGPGLAWFGPGFA